MIYDPLYAAVIIAGVISQIYFTTCIIHMCLCVCIVLEYVRIRDDQHHEFKVCADVVVWLHQADILLNRCLFSPTTAE